MTTPPRRPRCPARAAASRRRAAARCAAALAAAAAAFAAPRAQAAEVLVAVAANFAGPLARIGEAFSAATGHTLKVSSGATGKFYTQVAAGGAPFEVLLAADDETPRRLLAEGHAVPGSAFTYAIGQLVLWSRTPGLVDGDGAVLASPRFRRLAIANPKVAPYGAAALQVLQARGLHAAVADRLVTGESIAQAHQFALTGNADLAFVALSQVAVPGRAPEGSLWRVPPALYREIRQDAVLLKAGAHNPAARALLDHLRGPAARALIEAHGYALPR
ncbi:molybdate ABC transporter substrate-binding protein [Ideonella sp.]|uniref:molybdate ABC transporter substrate-binding protein n=1 Tax=Ideonella sp. TaxID=1929293 RepID=UPI0035AFD823